MFSMSGNSLLTFPRSYRDSDHLENLDQLPVREVLRGTDDFVLWIFTISSVFMFLRSRNPWLTLLQSYYVSVTSKIKVNFRFERYTDESVL